MTQRKRGLGKGLGELGLSELIGEIQRVHTPVNFSQTVFDSVATVETEVKEKENQGLRFLDVDLLKPGRYQPRRVFNQEALQELADSIKTQGIIQPLVIRSTHEGYEIIAGERRWRAAQLAGLQQVPVIVRDIPDKTALAIALIENIQRQDLNALEEAFALQRLIDEFELTHQEASEMVGKSRTMVTNLLRLLKLHPSVRDMLQQNQIEMGHARALLSLSEYQQPEVANIIVEKSLSVRQTEQLVKKILQPAAVNHVKPKMDPDISALQNELSDKLGASVQVLHSSQGAGKLVIHYNSLEELEGILTHLR